MFYPSDHNQKKRLTFFYLLILAILPLAPALSKAEGKNLRNTPIVEAVKRASPAVVNIGTEQVVRERQNPFYSNRDPFFEEFFGDFFETLPERRVTKQSLGSGVIIDPDGYILTNEHVILKTSKITVSLSDGREFEGKIIGSDKKTDLAIIKIKDKNPLPSIKMGESSDLMIGETVIAIGNPFGLSHTVTTGVISAIDRSIKADPEHIYNDFIQTDASINPGNSGGALLNIEGQLIGITTAIYQKAEGIGFAIPINKARRIVKDLIEFGEVHNVWLGIFTQDLTPQLSKFFKLPAGRGVLISNVARNSPAEKAGIHQGDIILKVADKIVKSREDYEALLVNYTPGSKIPITLYRDGKEISYMLTAQVLSLESADEFAYQWLGIKAEEITSAKRQQLRLEAGSGVIVNSVMHNSPADEIGIRAGDIIRQINNQTITHMDSFRKAIMAARQKNSVLLLIQRGSLGYYVTLQP